MDIQHRSARGPAALYLALSVVLVVLVASLAFTARQPPPPQIAELTPQAQHQITKAPSQLGSNIGSSSGGQCNGAGPCSGGNPPTRDTTTTTTSPGAMPSGASAPVQVASILHCFGNPPRQIQDTQSPPCIAYWSGNNGGATYRGVTGNQINVLTTPGTWDTNASRVMADLASFFNRYFELYGRKIVLTETQNPGTSCAASQSLADGAVKQSNPFAVLDNSTQIYSPCYVEELAHDHVVVSSDLPWATQSAMASYAPYYWQYPMAIDDALAQSGDFVCAQLAGKDATYSPDPSISSKPRRFGLILEYMQASWTQSPAPIVNALGRCGVKLAASEVYEEPDGQDDSSWWETAVQKMQNAGVTTILVASPNDPQYGVAEAEAQDYHPEWVILPDYWYNDFETPVFWTTADQRLGLLGLSSYPDAVPYDEATLNWALQAVDPGFQENYSYAEYYQYQELYWTLLLVASGIQMAGPDLTPATFQRGLQLASFPNPYSPEQEGAAGFPASSHSMATDLSVTYWSNTTPSPFPDANNGAGTWCYVDGGERFNQSNWGTPMNIYQGACDGVAAGS